MTDRTLNQRMARLRDRRRAAGIVYRSFWCPDSLWRDMSREAARRGITISDVVVERCRKEVK